MKQLVRHTIRQYHMLPDGARVLCGLSGGADSVSLVLCLQELGYQVCACHLNHGMRGAQADADEAFCRDFCEKHNIPFVSERCDVFAEAEKRKLSAETAAREMRYDFFARCAERMQVPYLATAHTADDNLETMLFHLIRGTGSAGLAGIPPVRGSIVRPLIAVERRQIERFLIERGQNWCTDATNLDDSCTRNKIRHHVIPALRDIEPCAARHALEAAQLVRQDNAYLDAQAREETLPLARMPEALKARRVRSMLKQAGVPMGEITRRHIRAVCTLADKRSGTVSLPGQFRAVNRRGTLSVVPETPKTAPVHIKPNQAMAFGAYTVSIVRKISDIYSSFKYYPIAYDTINMSNLTVRTWQSSDRMQLPGTRGTRSLKRLYAERGIAPDERDSLPVLCSGDSIVAAAGIGTDVRFCGQSGFFAVCKR